MARPTNLPIGLPKRVTSGSPITAAWANQIRQSLDCLKNRGSTGATQFKIGDTLPPFWPILIKDGKFIISDGYVINFTGGNANTDALNLYYPTGMGTQGGDRTEIAIADGDYIYIKTVVDKEGDPSTPSIEVSSVDKDSFNPDPTASAGVGTGGEYWHKIAYCVPADLMADPPTGSRLLMWLAGSHILLRGRGHNLDLHVWLIYLDGGSFTPVSDHYLCWRNGDYVGKFATGDTRPGYIGGLDTDDVSYVSPTP